MSKLIKSICLERYSSLDTELRPLNSHPDQSWQLLSFQPSWNCQWRGWSGWYDITSASKGNRCKIVKASSHQSSILKYYINLREWPLSLLLNKSRVISSIQRRCVIKRIWASPKEPNYSIGSFPVAWSNPGTTARYWGSMASSTRESRRRACRRRKISYIENTQNRL